MSDNEDAATDTAPMNDAKSTGRWVWGSLGAACLLWIFAACTPWLNNWLGSRGEVGDFLGGVSAPVFGFVGMVLVYRSFQAQVESNRQQIRALEDERAVRREDEQQKAIVEIVSRLSGILEHACYERCHEDPHHTFNGVSAIFHFCTDMRHATRAGTIYEHNAVLADVIGLWLFEANSALRWAFDDDPVHFETLKAHIQPLYAFALSRSINTLIGNHGFVGGHGDDAIRRIKESKAKLDMALEGHFEPETPA